MNKIKDEIRPSQNSILHTNVYNTKYQPHSQAEDHKSIMIRDILATNRPQSQCLRDDTATTLSENTIQAP